MSDYFDSGKFEEEWYVETKINIQECRMMLSHLDYSIKMWPGSPARPVEEQEFLQMLRNKYFAMVSDFTLYNQFKGEIMDTLDFDEGYYDDDDED